VIRSEAEKKNGSVDRKVMQDIGNDMKQKYGAHILAKMAVEYLGKDKQLTIVDGIRNPAEVEYLKKKFGDDFKLIAIDAPIETRFNRILEREDTRDPKNFDEFKVVDERDQGKDEPSHGQRVGDCMKMADHTIDNDSSFEDLYSKLKNFLNGFQK